MSWKATTALIPSPGARANGMLAHRPIARVMIPATRQVLVTTAGNDTSSPAIVAPVVRMTGFTMMM
jgi:hypothetical protein